MREAKQLLIQQKLELQGQVEAAQGALEHEQKEHQATRDSRNQREEQLHAQTKDVQDQLVGYPKKKNPTRFIVSIIHSPFESFL